MTENSNIIDKVPNSSNIININHSKDKISSNNCYYDISYYKKNFFDESEYSKFIKAIEKIVRKSDKYSSYINYLKNIIGLDKCALFGNIDDDDIEIEMHHGPILTLFDYCSIVVDHHLVNNNNKISTFNIADEILKLHYENIIQVVMLSKTAHQAVHSGKIFISVKQAWGDINEFLNRYKDGISNENRKKINEYIELCKKYKTTDNDLFKMDQLGNWNKQNVTPLNDNDVKIN